MGSSLVKRLKPWVSTFSEGIKLEYSHGDEIHIGGEIVNIFDLSKFIGETKVDPGMVQIDIDDNVGPITIMIPSEAFYSKQKEHDLKAGDVVLATGKVYDPSNALKKNTKSSCPSVICWDIKPLIE